MRDAADVRRRLRQLRYLIFYHLAHRRYAKAMDAYARRGMVTDGVFQRYKYLGDYFARSFSRRTRRSMILAHYRFVEAHVSGAAHHAITHGGIELWRNNFNDTTAVIRLTSGEFAPMEGEWQLQFAVDDVIVCTLSFLFAPNPRAAAKDRVACLIGGVQGGYDCRSTIRTVAKAHQEISPTVMLILSVKAVAQALGVESVLGVSSREQVVGLYAADRIKADYDTMWINEGALCDDSGFYALSDNIVERDLSAVPRSHRRRTRLKRERKAAMLDMLAMTAASTLAG